MDFIFYLVCFGFGLIFTIVSAFLGHLFGGGESGMDVGTGGHAEVGFHETGLPGLSPFSPTTIASFITAFGGFGLIFSRIEATRSVWVSAPLSLLGGLIMAGGVMLLFGKIFHITQSSSESRIGQLAGRTGTVITPIPAGGVGEIAYVHGGTRYTAPAREQDGAPVPNGQTVKITRISESQFYVVRI